MDSRLCFPTSETVKPEKELISFPGSTQNWKVLSSHYLWVLYCMSVWFKQKGPESNSKVVESSPLRLSKWGCNISLSTQTRCLPPIHKKSRQEAMVRVSAGKKRERERFSFERILLLFCLGRWAERNVFMGPNTKQVHTLTGTHMHAQKDWQQHVNEIKKLKEENKHIKQNARRTRQQQVASRGRLTPQMVVVEF